MKTLKKLWHYFEQAIWACSLALAAIGITMCLWDIARNALNVTSLLVLLEEENKGIALAYNKCVGELASPTQKGKNNGNSKTK